MSQRRNVGLRICLFGQALDTETETETKDGDWKLQRGSTDSTGENETEEDPSDEDLEKDIRWVLFVTTFFALLYS